MGVKGEFRQWEDLLRIGTDFGFPRQPLQPSASGTLGLEIGGKNVTPPSYYGIECAILEYLKTAKGSRYSHATRRCSTGASRAWWRHLPRQRATSFSTEACCLGFRRQTFISKLLQHNISQSLPIYLYAFDLLNRDGELLVKLLFPAGARAVQPTNDKTHSAHSEKLPKSEVIGKERKVSANSREAGRRSCGLT